MTVQADVRDRAALDAAAARAAEEWGRLDVAVAAAAVIAGGRPLWQDDSLPALWAVDVLGVWHTAAACVPRMLAATADLYGVATDDLAQSQLLRDLLAPEELAEVIAMCCSDAGWTLNGALVTADGGFGG